MQPASHDDIQKRIPSYKFGKKLGEGPRSVVFMAFHERDPHRPLSVKVLRTENLSDSDKRHFRQRIEHLKVLDDFHLITPLSFSEQGNLYYIAQDYFPGVTLDQWAKKGAKDALGDFFTIACGLAEALKSLHEAGVVHGGVKPHNILVEPGTLDIRLIDFVTPLDVRDVSHFIYDRSFVEGTLAYTSPEQTGRINHKVDFSTDLYSLGITFYELLTGRLPFLSTDPLELIHSHLAEEAPPAQELNPAIPHVLGKIVSRLTLKQPEKRYQSASGLLADLDRCRKEYSASGTVLDFPLGTHDRPHRIVFISKMLGRDREAAVILDEYDKAAKGSFRFMLISGLPGIGKTRLIQELQKPIVEHRGYFTSGKFDLYQRNIPYSSLIQALRGLMRTFFTESDERVAIWRQKILRAVGGIGGLMTDVIPELITLIGPQPAVGTLPPVEARNRFHDVFGRFLSCLASEEHPLTLFIDDLQWCDVATFDFLSTIFASANEHPHLFLIGAYRHNEVDSSHSLTRLIQGVREKGQPLQEIRLEPLKAEHCHQMVSYILDSPLSQTRALSGFITKLTEGNPLFVSESLSYLHGEDLLFLDEDHCWRWDLDKIRRSDMPTTVVALFSSKVKRLPVDTVDLLEFCACMGNLFKPEEIAMVRETSLSDTFEMLKPALGLGLLTETKDHIQFVHDRVQEAVLSGIGEERRRQIHWQIGNHLLSVVPTGADLEKLDNIFTIAAHLNMETGVVQDKDTAYQLADINYHAGNKALDSLATEAANAYFRRSMDLLPDDCWDVQYERAFKVLQKLAKTELMCGRYANSERLLNELLDHARTDLDKAESLAEQTTTLSSIGNFRKAIETANRGLAFFGKSIPSDPQLAEDRREQLMNDINSRYGSNIWDTILNMPFTEERKSKIELAFYSELIPDLYMSGLVPQLYLSAVQSTQHCLAGGMDESVIYSFSIMGLYLGEQGQFQQAFRYEDLARDLSERYVNTFGATRGMNGVVWCNMHSRSHPEEVVKYCLKAIQCGKNCGDLYNAGLSYGPLMWNLQVQGLKLSAIEEYAEECLQFSERYHLSFSVGLVEAMRSAWIAPMKKGYTPIPMDDKIKRWERENHIASAGSYYVHMALTSYYFGEYETAERYLNEVERYLSGLTDNVLKREWYVFRVLNALRLHEKGLAYQTREELFSYIQPIIEKIEAWAELGPLLKPYLAFVHVELERVAGEFRKGRSLFLDAIAIAHDQRYTLLEGHINECLGEFLEEAGHGTAGVYFAEASRLYKKCRAEGKRAALIQKHPEHLDVEPLACGPEAEESGVSYAFPSLDIDYLMKSSLAISAEIDPEALLHRVMNVVLEASGAQHGYLLIEEAGRLVVRAENHVTEKGVVRTVHYDLKDAEGISKAIVCYVRRTGEGVVLNNACEEGDFRDNPEVQAMRLKSVLSLALVKQSRLVGILYLENRLSDQVFTPGKARTIELLASQIAISLENARLVDEMRRAEEQIKASLKEKEILLKEIHHRVKNNLQVIYSLLRLQSRTIKDKADAEIFRESQNRVKSMALIHERIYQSKDLARIEFGEYVRKLATHLMRSYPVHQDASSMKIDIEDVFLDIEVAIPCGLIINELVSNCLKHAFPHGRRGKIDINLRGQDRGNGDRFQLTVSDDGVGFPADLDFRKTETLGLQLVKTLVEQLKGEIALEKLGGTRFTIGFGT